MKPWITDNHGLCFFGSGRVRIKSKTVQIIIQNKLTNKEIGNENETQTN